MRLWLVVAGLIHGAFATGGPVVVYMVGRTLTDKSVFRVTLSGLWLLLNTVLLATYAWRDRLSETTLSQTLRLAPFMLIGMLLGEALHRRVPLVLFKRLVFLILSGAGILLTVRM